MAWLYIAAYLLLLIPTYILPYFGSNSSLFNAVGAAVGMGLSPLWWLHAWCLVMLVILGWWRGKWTAKAWLPVFPILAGAFDIIPILNMIPLVPTVMHLIAMAVGVISANRSDTEAISGINRKVGVAAGITTLIALLGVALFIIGIGRMAANAKQPKPANTTTNSKAVESPKEATKPLDTQPTIGKSSEPVKKESSSYEAKPPAHESRGNSSEPKPAAENKQPVTVETKTEPAEKVVEKKRIHRPRPMPPNPTSAPRKNNEGGSSVRYITIK